MPDLQESAAIYEEQGIRLAYLFSRAHLGYLALYQGEITNARSIFSETVRDFYSDKNEDGVMFTLEGMGGLSVAVGKPDVAAQLIGWADMVREKFEANPRPPLEQADVDKIIAACLVKMGEVAFSDAYDEGQKMTMDEAVEFALKENSLSFPSNTSRTQSFRKTTPQPRHPRRRNSKRRWTPIYG